MPATLAAAIRDFSHGPDDVPGCGRRYFIYGHRQVAAIQFIEKFGKPGSKMSEYRGERATFHSHRDPLACAAVRQLAFERRQPLRADTVNETEINGGPK